jgi:hypothetical protein
MSSRAEEKERRRQERLAAEQAAQSSANRRKRLGLVGGVVLVAAIAVVAVLAIASGGNGDGGGASGNSRPEEQVAIPEQKIANLQEAVRASGCKLTTSRIEGRGHVTEPVTYRTNPPTSGSHDPTPSEDGIYEPANPPDVEQSVHSLEHGRINFQYKAGTDQKVIGQMTSLFSESVKGTDGYHSLLFQNQTKMEPQIAATAWGRSLTCDTVTDGVWDALRAFRRDRVDKGPEFIP